MKRRRAEHDESGMATVLVGLVMVALLVFAAFAIDVGNSYAAKRQTQSAADEGALAGGVESLQTGNVDLMISKAKQFASTNSLSSISAADWAACTDSGALAVSSLTLSPTQGTPCISFGTASSGGFVEMRVRVPDVPMKTFLASVIGVDKIDHHAVATIRIGAQGGGAFPSSVFAGQGAGDQVCLINGPNGHIGYCTDSQSGQFGTFNPWYYGINCTSGNTGDNIARAIALGLDHQIFVGPSPASLLHLGGADRLNGDGSCTQLFPNTLERNTGFDSAQAITSGLLLGGNSPGGSFAGRLAGGEYSQGAHGLNAARLANTDIDNVPIWYFFKPSVKSDGAVPAECRAAAKMNVKRSVQDAIDVQVQDGVYKDFATGTRYASPEDLMSGCLSKWTSAAGTLFDASIGTTMRLGSVPRFWETQAGPASSVYHIKQFVPVYLWAVVGKSTGSSDGPIHYAGDPMGNGVTNNSYWNRSPSQDKKAVEGLGAVVIPCGALPTSICTTPNGEPESVGGSMQQVRLSQ